MAYEGGQRKDGNWMTRYDLESKEEILNLQITGDIVVLLFHLVDLH